MQETFEILTKLIALLDAGEKAALATVVETSGSTYRRPGARLLISAKESWGAVSAGCLEDEVIAVAKQAIGSGLPQLLRFDTTEEMDIIAGTGLGCRGTISVFIQPITPNSASHEAYRLLFNLIENDKSADYAMAIESSAGAVEVGAQLVQSMGKLEFGDGNLPQLIASDLNRLSNAKSTFTNEYAIANESVRVYCEKITPRPQLVIFGAGFDAQPLAQFSSRLGFKVIVVDHRQDYLQMHRFPNADKLILRHPTEHACDLSLKEQDLIVIMTHNYLHDFEILKRAFASEVAYIGQIGPRDRTEELLEKMEGELGRLKEQDLARLHSPIGLDLGAETPEEIAISILSEIIARQNRRMGGFLKERHLPIHDVN